MFTLIVCVVYEQQLVTGAASSQACHRCCSLPRSGPPKSQLPPPRVAPLGPLKELIGPPGSEGGIAREGPLPKKMKVGPGPGREPFWSNPPTLFAKAELLRDVFF